MKKKKKQGMYVQKTQMPPHAKKLNILPLNKNVPSLREKDHPPPIKKEKFLKQVCENVSCRQPAAKDEICKQQMTYFRKNMNTTMTNTHKCHHMQNTEHSAFEQKCPFLA